MGTLKNPFVTTLSFIELVGFWTLEQRSMRFDYILQIHVSHVSVYFKKCFREFSGCLILVNGVCAGFMDLLSCWFNMCMKFCSNIHIASVRCCTVWPTSQYLSVCACMSQIRREWNLQLHAGVEANSSLVFSLCQGWLPSEGLNGGFIAIFGIKLVFVVWFSSWCSPGQRSPEEEEDENDWRRHDEWTHDVVSQQHDWLW